MNSTEISHKVITRPRNILIIKLGARGDVLRTTSILPPLKKKYPLAGITWLVDRGSVEILEGNPYIERILNPGFQGREINFEKFDFVINLDEDKTAAGLVSGLACRKTGFFIEGERVLSTPSFEPLWRMGLCGPSPENDRLKKANRLSYQRLLYRALDFGDDLHRPVIVIPDDELKSSEKMICGFKNPVGINFSSSSFWPAKRIPVESVVQLSGQLRGEGYTPVIFGSEEEKEELEFLKENAGAPVLGPGLPLKRFAAVISRCSAVISTDSLALHLAAALRVPLLALFGPTSSYEAELYGKGIKLTAELGCACCYRKTCSKTPFCMASFEPESIIENLKKLTA